MTTMINAFLERTFDDPMTLPAFRQVQLGLAGCLELHRVEWQNSMLAGDGKRIVCWFRANDMESVRVALRSRGTDVRVLWPGSVYHAPGFETVAAGQANVAVGRRFAEAVTLEEIQAIEDAGAHCLEMRGVTFVRTYFSADGKRMLCQYRAPDVESVRQAEREAKVPFESAWGFQAIL